MKHRVKATIVMLVEAKDSRSAYCVAANAMERAAQTKKNRVADYRMDGSVTTLTDKEWARYQAALHPDEIGEDQ